MCMTKLNILISFLAIFLFLSAGAGLAKDNRSEFWAHFQEKYPDFSRKLLEVCPGLKTTELILCAYIYLGFNTKDIAEYTFKAVQTVKNNKYNLRKKLSITAKEDMVVWLRTIVGVN